MLEPSSTPVDNRTGVTTQHHNASNITITNPHQKPPCEEMKTGVANDDVDWLFRGKSKKIVKKLASNNEQQKESKLIKIMINKRIYNKRDLHRKGRDHKKKYPLSKEMAPLLNRQRNNNKEDVQVNGLKRYLHPVHQHTRLNQMRWLLRQQPLNQPHQQHLPHLLLHPLLLNRKRRRN